MSLLDALKAVEAAQGDVKDALRAHRNAPPNAEFSKRLRNTGAGFGELAAALAVTIHEENATSMRPGAPIALPHELTPQAFRPGPPDLWSEWDTAVLAWQGALVGTRLEDLRGATDRLSQLALRLADALDEAGAAGRPSADAAAG